MHKDELLHDWDGLCGFYGLLHVRNVWYRSLKNAGDLLISKPFPADNFKKFKKKTARKSNTLQTQDMSY